MKRNIIKIDEEKCTGCGLCIVNCAEGSLEIQNGKAVLVKESLCDGLGACLGHCPEGALTIEQRDADEFDEAQVETRLKEIGREPHAAPAPATKEVPCGCPGSAPLRMPPQGGGCPGSRLQTRAPAAAAAPAGDAGPSELTHWPVQLGLLPPTAPFFAGADLVLAADCTPFAYPDFHRDFLKGHAVAVACPKLDNADAHYAKLVELFKHSGIKSLTVVRMEVPCCAGLVGMARAALKESGMDIPMKEVVIGRHGEIVSNG